LSDIFFLNSPNKCTTIRLIGSAASSLPHLVIGVRDTAPICPLQFPFALLPGASLWGATAFQVFETGKTLKKIARFFGVGHLKRKEIAVNS
jgi:hypothetical protein